MTFTFGSLFSGIGGFDLGFEQAGMECRWQVEIDPYCLKVLEKHWPDVPHYRDVYELSGGSLEAVDAICGGFPCQPVSLAGRRKGTSDERWLWPEYARLVGEVRPRYVIVENVPGLYSQGGSEVVADLAALGYEFEWDRLSAQAVGAPHKRERFILVAYSDSQRRQQIPQGSHEDEGQHAGRPKADNHELERDGEGDGEGGISRAMAHPQILNLGAGFRQDGTRGIWDRRSGNGGGPIPEEGWEPDPAHPPESQLGRMAYGVRNGVDRNRVLGNALVPQVAEVIGRAIMDRERELHATRP